MRVAAQPSRLRTFATSGHQLDPPLLRAQLELSTIRSVVRRSCPGAVSVMSDPAVRVAAVRSDAQRLDRWVDDVGTWLDAADHGTLGRLSPSLVAAVMAPVTIMRSRWPAPVVVGYNPLAAPRRGTFDAAGYGAACSGGHTAGVSIMGPDGLGYPVVVPGPAGTDQETLDWMPTDGADISMGTINAADDRGRAWTTTTYSEAVVNARNDTAYKVAGAVAATAGWVAVSGPSVAADDIGRVLRVEPNGRPHLIPANVAKSVSTLRPTNPPTPEEVAPSPRGLAARRTVSTANLADLAMSAIGGWRAATNEGAGFVQAQYQRDGAGHRRVLVRGYEVRVVDGQMQMSAGYWNGRGWTPLGTPTLKAPTIITAA